MRMPTPDNTLPMMTGEGPFGSVEMGGMFSVVKVRAGLARGDYKDPGWYRNPPGTVAYKVDAPTAAPARNSAVAGTAAATHGSREGRMMTMEVRAPPHHRHAGDGHEQDADGWAEALTLRCFERAGCRLGQPA